MILCATDVAKTPLAQYIETSTPHAIRKNLGLLSDNRITALINDLPADCAAAVFAAAMLIGDSGRAAAGADHTGLGPCGFRSFLTRLKVKILQNIANFDCLALSIAVFYRGAAIYVIGIDLKADLIEPRVVNIDRDKEIVAVGISRRVIAYLFAVRAIPHNFATALIHIKNTSRNLRKLHNVRVSVLVLAGGGHQQ